MTKDDIEHKAYLFFREKGLEYVDNIDELIEYCRDFAFPFVSYFEEKIAELKAENELIKNSDSLCKLIGEQKLQIEKMKSDVIKHFGEENNVLVARLLKEWEIKEND